MASNPNETSSAKADKIVEQIIVAVRANEFDRAAQLANSVLALGLHHPMVYTARALAFQQKGLFDEALAEFSQASSLSPDDAGLRNAMGVCLINLNRLPAALGVFEQALAIAPDNAHLHFRKGWALEMLGERDKSREAYEKAIAVDPHHADALASLAETVALRGDLSRAKSLAARALAMNAAQPTALVVLGRIDLSHGHFSAAEGRFRKVLASTGLTPRARAGVQGLLGDALDGLDRVDEAFAAYEAEKNGLHALHAGSEIDTQQRDAIERAAAFVETSTPELWKPGAANKKMPQAADRHAFLLGFFRSGTTLLEQVLASHSDVVASEEQNFLIAQEQRFLLPESGLEEFAALSEEELDVHREAYWREVVARNGGLAGKLFVDKFPLHTMALPLIAKLFPNAKILFALRDPRDVLLSCYRRHFELNAAMFELLKLETAARFYGTVMRVGSACHAKLPLAFHECRYEDLVADFDGNTAAICDFLGISWSEDLRDFHRKDVLSVQSPSAAQIRRPLNTDSVGQWRRYRRHLAPALPLLEPWVSRFGYPAD